MEVSMKVCADYKRIMSRNDRMDGTKCYSRGCDIRCSFLEQGGISTGIVLEFPFSSMLMFGKIRGR